MEKIKVGNLEVAPGESATGEIKVTNRPGGDAISMPVMVTNGEKDGPVLWLNGSIHGDEPQGPLAIQTLCKRVDPEELSGAIVGVPIMNVPAFESGSRGNPDDPYSWDMNRIYPGDHDGRLTERIAAVHRDEMAETADMEISVHSGGHHSYLETTMFAPDESLELAKAMGPEWDLLLEAARPSGSPMAVLYEQGKQSISIEQGGNSSLKPSEINKDISLIVDGFTNVLRHFEMMEGKASYAGEWRRGEQEALYANKSGLWLPDPEFSLHEPVSEGTPVGKILNPYGEVLEEITTPCDGEAFGVRSLTSVQTGGWVLFFAKVNRKITS